MRLCETDTVLSLSHSMYLDSLALAFRCVYVTVISEFLVIK